MTAEGTYTTTGAMLCPHCVHPLHKGETHQWGKDNRATCLKGCARCQ